MSDGVAECICLSVCPKRRSPVCGTDGRLYRNHCALHRAACLSATPVALDHSFACLRGSYPTTSPLPPGTHTQPHHSLPDRRIIDAREFDDGGGRSGDSDDEHHPEDADPRGRLRPREVHSPRIRRYEGETLSLLCDIITLLQKKKVIKNKVTKSSRSYINKIISQTT